MVIFTLEPIVPSLIQDLQQGIGDWIEAGLRGPERVVLLLCVELGYRGAASQTRVEKGGIHNQTLHGSWPGVPL